MQPREKTDNWDRSIIGTFPKITIDPRLEVIDSHSRRDPVEELLVYIDHELNARVAFAAAEQIFFRFRSAFPHIEAIKISFLWNRNLGGPYIRAQVYLAIQNTRKLKIDSQHPCASLFVHAEERLVPGVEEHSFINGLLEKLLADLRSNLALLGSELETGAGTVRNVADLFPLPADSVA